MNEKLSQLGITHIFILIIAAGLLAFLFITNTFDFKDRLFSQLFPKPPSGAQSYGVNATLEDFWNGTAQWKFTHKLTLENTGWAYGYGAGTHIEVTDNTWYMFHRKIYWGNKCGTEEKAGTAIRKSLDQGKTWSNPIDIIVPTIGTPWECAATDGDAYYEAGIQKWHYLFQCLAPTGGWKTCHAERNSYDPMGPFSQTLPNPVLSGKDLWSKICNDNSDDCVNIAGGINQVYDESTFDIFRYDGQYFYVSFHGYDGLHGYRGIAKTTDFLNWVAGDEIQGVPKDAVLDLYDQTNWREVWNQGGPIGHGAGRVLYENGYYYMLSEGADINLYCTDGQNWDWGLYRSQSLTNVTWESYPLGNPIIYSSKFPERNGEPLACNPAYAEIFKDPLTNKYYTHYTRESVDPAFAGIYFYELGLSSNLLKNADFWKCSIEGWNRIPPDGSSTNMVVYRYPNNSSDGNCYLATNCGTSSCVAGQSIFQDTDMTNVPSRNVEYGGKFSTDGGDGTIDLVLHELDAGGNIITSHKSTENINPSYRLVTKYASLDANVKKLRLETYLLTPQTFRMDEMFVNPAYQSTPSPTPSSSPSPTPSPSPSSTPAPSPTPPPRLGDINGDGSVNVIDFSIMLSRWGTADVGADLNGDGIVNVVDFSILLSNWGS